MIDLNFIEFYVRKKYNQSIDSYFGVSRPVLSIWRKKGIPKSRLDAFMIKEKSFDIFELFEGLYKKDD